MSPPIGHPPTDVPKHGIQTLGGRRLSYQAGASMQPEP